MKNRELMSSADCGKNHSQHVKKSPKKLAKERSVLSKQEEGLKKLSVDERRNGTPLMRHIMKNHKLLVEFFKYKGSPGALTSFRRILTTHLTHNLDLMDIEELIWNHSVITDVVSTDFHLTEDCSALVIATLEQMIALRKNGRPVFKTLVDANNRRNDKRAIEREHGLSEQGLLNLRFYSKSQSDVRIATGYYRMLYGDHGPYIEFTEDQVNWAAFPIVDRRGVNAYFDYFYSKDRSVRLYYQRRNVKNKPNPPHLFGARRAENNRPEGYADYVTGRYYADANVVMVKEDTYISVLKRIRPRHVV